jgi:hypothetical protein
LDNKMDSHLSGNDGCAITIFVKNISYNKFY